MIIYKQSGITLIFTIFIIMLLSLLTTALLKISYIGMTENKNSLLSQKAFFAAESGLQIASTIIKHANENSICEQEFTYTAPGLEHCSSNITCAYLEHLESNDEELHRTKIHTIISLGRCISGQDTAYKTVQARLRKVVIIDLDDDDDDD